MNCNRILPTVLVTALLLTGCNHDQDNEVTAANYQGIIWSDNAVPQAARVVIENESRALLTLWDDRNHQTSYLGHRDNQHWDFSSASVYCDQSGAALNCTNSNGQTQLVNSPLSETNISSLTGTYQALYQQNLYQLVIANDGTLSISGNNCVSQGYLSQSASVPLLVEMTLADSQCLNAGRINLVSVLNENQNLISLDIETNSDSFPQVWIKG